MQTQPTSPNPGWDPAVLRQAERELARLVGPVARLLVRRAAEMTTDVDMLYCLLAERLGEDDRAAFLGVAAQSPRPKPSSASSSEAAVSKWDPELLKQLEHRLAHLKGPVAHLMVKRAAAWADDLDALYGLLAERLANPQERAWLLAGRNSMVQATAAADALAAEAEASGIRLLFEAFADRRYDDSGGLLPRDRTGAVLDRAGMLAQVEQLLADASVTSIGGRRLSLRVDTLCVHGDNPDAVSAVAAIRALLNGG